MTTLPTFLLVVIVLVVLFLGTLIGNFTSGVEAKKKLEEARARAEIVAEQARGEVDRAMRAAQAAQTASNLSGRTVLRLWLDDGERPALDLDGQPVDATRLSESHRKRLVNLLSAMRPWIEGSPAVTPPSAPAAVSPAPAVAAPQPVPAPAKKEEKPAAPTSIVAQVDEILQVRLAAGPLAGSGIKLLESPEGSVTVAVGSQKFNSIGEVSDPRIQSEIRAAIAEWEKKYVPGM
jgi:hypothetical protein